MLLAALAGPALACSCIRGPGGFAHPPELLVPANARGLVWWSASGDPAAAGVTATRDGEKVEVELEPLAPRAWLVAPAGGFAPGATWRFRQEVIPFAEALAAEVVVKVSEATVAGGDAKIAITPLPEGDVQVAAGASCTAPVRAASATVAVELPAEVRPFTPALAWETTVDGASWRPARSICEAVPFGRSWQGPGLDLVYAACAELVLGDRGLAQGAHRVRVTATLPGTDLRWSVEAPVTLVCGR